MKNMRLPEASLEAKKLAFKLTAGYGVRNAALVSKLLAKTLKIQHENQKKSDKV